MTYSNHFWWILCLISLKGLESAKIYVINVPTSQDSSIADDDYEINDNKIFKHTQLNGQSDNTDIVMCHRLFGSIYGNKKQHNRCIQAMKNKRAKNLDFDTTTVKFQASNRHPKKRQPNQVGRQQFKPFLDLTRFSQDYLDVNDLARSNFANEYVDVNEFRNIRNIVPQCKEELDEFGQITKGSGNCNRESRKSIMEDVGNFKFKVEDSSESESEPVEKRHVVTKKKTKSKRYKVVSNESGNHWDSSDKSTDMSENKVGSGSSIENDSDSIEVTTRKPKKKKSKKGTIDGYMYMQGNKLFDQDDFRRNLLEYLRGGNDKDTITGDGGPLTRVRRSFRMSHFLPKRYHWDEDDYQNLGYYWFNGPRGKYKKWQSR